MVLTWLSLGWKNKYPWGGILRKSTLCSLSDINLKIDRVLCMVGFNILNCTFYVTPKHTMKTVGHPKEGVFNSITWWGNPCSPFVPNKCQVTHIGSKVPFVKLAIGTFELMHRILGKFFAPCLKSIWSSVPLNFL